MDGPEDRPVVAALRGSYEALYENIPLMCFTLDAHGLILAVNAYGAEQLGYRPKELAGRPVTDIFHPEDRSAVGEQLCAAFGNTGRVARWQFRKVRKDGLVFWVQEAVRVVVEGRRKIALVVCEDVTEQVEAERDYLCYQQELRALTSELTLAEERERRRIASGLHDQIGQTLAIAKLRLGTLEEAKSQDQAITEIGSLLDQAMRETRSLTFELSCPVLYRLGLEAALRDLGEQLCPPNGIRFHMESDDEPKPLGEDTRVFLFRIVQELLCNILKHAGARNVRLELARVAAEIRITLVDDGVGFEISELGRGPTPAGGLGLFSIRERLDHLGGGLEIETALGAGTTTTISAPIDRELETETDP